MVNNMKKKLFFILFIFASVIVACNSRKDPNQRTYENSYNSNSTTTGSLQDRNYVGNSLNTGNSPYNNRKSAVTDDPYYNNSLNTGSSPYSCYGSSASDESQISVSTSASSNCDVVVIIKSGGEIARNVYIQAGGSFTFYIPNGTYQVFFYGGKGWNPNKVMPNGLKGGFVANESYSKDSPVHLEYQGLTYELIPQPNGNFSTQQSNINEIF